MSNNEWTLEQTVELFECCEQSRKRGNSLSDAFRYMAEKTSRSLNSVRNYYYGQSKTFELVPEVARKLGIRIENKPRNRFVPFAESEVRELVEKILTAKGRGISVRRAILDIAGGDSKKALRYQNKYRAALRSRRELVENVVKDLAERHMPYKDPYAKPACGNLERLTEYLATLGDDKVERFLSLMEKLT